jgi:Leucine-rich repeat (LRR) protein
LYSNNISEISGLDKLTSLNVLSIGKNKFRDHLSIFVYLKKLKNNLQVLKMAENNFQKQGNSSGGDDYKTMAIITLGKQLRYVDYELITEDERERAK